MNAFHTLTSLPLFGILLCLLAYVAACRIRQATGSVAANPFLIAAILVVAVLLIFRIPYQDFNQGGQFINFFLSPITVILAVPLYKHRNLLNHYLKAIVAGIAAGVAAAMISVIGFSRLMGLDSVLERSLVSKSITTPIGIEITRSIEGVEGITILAIILSGIFGAMIAPVVFLYTGIRHPVAQGIGLGSASHAIGTSKAIEMGEQQGAISGLTIGIAGITTVLVVLVLNVFLWN